jgi:cytochrome c-type biogenesis protein CcmH
MTAAATTAAATTAATTTTGTSGAGATGRAGGGRTRRLRSALRGLPGWIVLAVIAAITLAIGSIHPASSAASARIAHLDSVIKCPSCDNLSIGDSNAATARALRAVVASDVHAGESDAEIEAYVVSRYGAAVLLSPANRIVWIVPIVALIGSAIFLAVFLVRRGRTGGALRRREVPAGTAPDAPRADQRHDEELVAAALAAREVGTRDG